MINGLKVLAFIPARGGSKGLKRKNIKKLDGIPLVGYSIREALKSKYIDYVFVSTEDEEIRDVSVGLGAEVPFLRSMETAQDTSKTIDTMVEAVNELKKNAKEFDIVVLLQPTSPMRTVRHIDESIEKYVENGMEALVSVVEVEQHPAYMREITEEGTLKDFITVPPNVRRQDLKPYYRLNGAIYINKMEEIVPEYNFSANRIPYIMDSASSVDVDTIDDFEYAEFLIKK